MKTLGAVAARGRPRSAEADRAIADATVELLREAGYAELTMAGVAARAGVSTATLYRRFASKDDLVVSAIETIIDPSPPVDTGSLEGDVRHLLGRVATTMSGDRGAVLRGLAGEMLGHQSLREAVRDRLTAPMDAGVAAMLDRAVTRGELSSAPPSDIAVALIAGPGHYRLLLADQPIDERVVEHLVPMVLRALGA